MLVGDINREELEDRIQRTTESLEDALRYKGYYDQYQQTQYRREPFRGFQVLQTNRRELINMEARARHNRILTLRQAGPDLPVASVSGDDEAIATAIRNRRTRMRFLLGQCIPLEDAEIDRRAVARDPYTQPNVPEPSPGWPNWFQGPPGVHWTAGGWMFQFGEWLEPTRGWRGGRNRRGVVWTHDKPILPPPLDRGNWYWDHLSNSWRT